MKTSKKKLSAWAVPTCQTSCTPKWAEHTFATWGKTTKIWSCSSGGHDDPEHVGVRHLVSGQGSFSMAKCLGQRNSGILWLFNGVCHQCTNRVLFAAHKRITVAGAKGWVISHSMYGVYGIDVPIWEGLKAVCSSAEWFRSKSISAGEPNAMPELPVEDSVEEDEEEDGFDVNSSPSSTEELSSDKYFDYHQQLSLSSGRGFRSSEDRQADELSILFQSMLDGGIASFRISELQNNQLEFHRKWTACHLAWLSGDFTSDKLFEYRAMLTEALFSAFEKNLGESQYASLYGVSPSDIARGFDKSLPSSF